jgi:hypothetical protein
VRWQREAVIGGGTCKFFQRLAVAVSATIVADCDTRPRSSEFALSLGHPRRYIADVTLI